MNFTLAIDGYNGAVDYVPLTAFGKLAETIHEHTDKGHLVAIEGRITSGKYTNDQGETVYTLDAIAGTCRSLQLAVHGSQRPHPTVLIPKARWPEPTRRSIPALKSEGRGLHRKPVNIMSAIELTIDHLAALINIGHQLNIRNVYSEHSNLTQRLELDEERDRNYVLTELVCKCEPLSPTGTPRKHHSSPKYPKCTW